MWYLEYLETKKAKEERKKSLVEEREKPLDVNLSGEFEVRAGKDISFELNAKKEEN